jgi:hypothetical protein
LLIHPTLPALLYIKHQAWKILTEEVLKPAHPFSFHQQLFQEVYQAWDASKLGPPPVWIPTPDLVLQSNAASFMQQLQVSAQYLTTESSGNLTESSILTACGLACYAMSHAFHQISCDQL